MRKHLRILPILFLFLPAILPAQKNLQAYLSYATFNTPEKGPYIETYLAVVGESAIFQSTGNGKFQGAVEIQLIFKKEGTVVDFKKYEVLSPEISDTNKISFDFIDQQRFLLGNGLYQLEITIGDKYSNQEPFRATEEILINYPKNEVSIAGLQLIDSFKESQGEGILTKSGYDLVPYVYNFYPGNKNKLIFYTEIYNTDKAFGEEAKYLVNWYIESYETGKTVSNLYRMKREGAKPVTVLFNQFDISKLPSGNYNLLVEVKDQKNERVAMNKLFFQRSNPGLHMDVSDIKNINTDNTFVSAIASRDSLAEYIKCLGPISSEMERVFALSLIEGNDLESMQQYFLNFWQTRDQINPHEAWLNYKTEVGRANSAFSTQISKGYETDRGRVYLKYGPPNTMTESYFEPSAYPYEIWHYYELDNQRNRKFVFFTRDLVTNDFTLIHSDANGEISNYRWQIELHKRDSDRSNLDEDGVIEHYGGKSEDYFINPR